MIQVKESKHNRDYIEVNFDALVGPTHNYAGLAFGNLASLENIRQVSHPREAALQGLRKMHLLMQLGLKQGILPPHERPNLPMLRNLGFSGTDIQILNQSKKIAPSLFYACYSSSSMWSANAATVTPSPDSQDAKLHITPANLISHFHRSIETEFTYLVLKRIFFDESKFVVHPPLPSHTSFGDEGAANHNRLCLQYGDSGLEIFVYGRKGFDDPRMSSQMNASTHPIKTKKHENYTPRIFPARQTLVASQAIARRHLLNKNACIFVKQNPHVIDKGVFHNDVISVMNKNVFLTHELAFEEDIDLLYQTLQSRASFPIHFINIKESEISVIHAVQSYLFNSQLVSLPNNDMALIAPEECREIPSAFKVVQKILESDNPIRQLHFVDCCESMKNGGGPACLRLRVVLSEDEQNALMPEIFLDEDKYQKLTHWVKRFYRESIRDEDLLDPLLIEESKTSLDELTSLLQLGSIYSFQKD